MSIINSNSEIDTVRASRAGHTFHERWAARRALQLVFPNDSLFAIAVEGLSSTETANPGDAAEEVADLVLYYGSGDNFSSCDRLETVQFKYRVREDEVTSSYLQKTIKKFCETIVGYEQDFTVNEIDKKLSFIFVTNAPFSHTLWDAITELKGGTKSLDASSKRQVTYLKELCVSYGIADPQRLFARIEFRAAEKSLSEQSHALRRTLIDWSVGADAQAKNRLYDLQELVLKKAGPGGQHNNLIKREDILDALDCLPEDLFPADTRFIDVGAIVERAEIAPVGELLKNSTVPVFVHAEGGVGKTVFIQSFAAKLSAEFEVVIFDCFGGGAYRSEEHSRHLPSIGIVQIVNELASRGLCDLLLPGSDDTRKVLKAARRRFEQAAKAIQVQSGKLGLLIIIDAADNAQLEADYRKEDAFPNVLLASLHTEPIEGMKLLLTARTHRKDSVIEHSRVELFELGPFKEIEARQFLKDRKPRISDVEFATAIARSGRNARVLDYLVQTWDVNVKGKAPTAPITVPEIIAQKCQKIISDLHVAGWAESEVKEFFVALSLLPPPIPLEDLASALSWPASQVSTAASDLAPMLERTPHGIIFRDEPTETYIHDNYAKEIIAQNAIADRLIKAQAQSTYAAEALPHFLVVINDSDRAFALADSKEFPSAIQSEFGRRRLALARLRAAFKLAVNGKDYDRIINVVMRLAQATTANMRGDEFIRRYPSLAVKLGDPDAQRRLFADRSGWRGARSARLAISHSFSGDEDEATIQRDSAIRWINWYVEQPKDDDTRNHVGPTVKDFTAVLLQPVIQSNFEYVDHNLASRSYRFSLSSSAELLKLLEQYDLTMGKTALTDFAAFSSTEKCTSLALKMQILAEPHLLSKKQVKSLAKALESISTSNEEDGYDIDFEESRGIQSEIAQAALTALFLSSRASAKSIIQHVPFIRPSGYDYSERYGPIAKMGTPLIIAFVRAWSSGKPLSYHNLLPVELKITRRAKEIASQKELKIFLAEQVKPAPAIAAHKRRRGDKRGKLKARYNSRECDEIAASIEMVLSVTAPIQNAVLSREPLSAIHIAEFLKGLTRYIRNKAHPESETSTDLLARTLGLICIRLIFKFANDMSIEQAAAIVSLVSQNRFGVHQKLLVLEHLARRPACHELSGQLAQHIAEQIRTDENISTRSSSYADLAAALLPVSIDESCEYYRQGLAQLDQMGGEDYDQIYSLLHYAAKQTGGSVKPELAQRLMNLCQLIAQPEPSKFGWTLFARAASMSIGLPAIAKLVRWDNQDVVKLSYGLPQLACFLAKAGKLSPLRATFFLTICEDHGWWDWQVGEGVSDLLSLSKTDDQRRIVGLVLQKLHVEHTLGAGPTLWESFLKMGDSYPGLLTNSQQDELRILRDEAKRKNDEYNSRNNSSFGYPRTANNRSTEEEADEIIKKIASACDHASPESIDYALRKVDGDERLSYGSRIKLMHHLKSSCPYAKRLEFLLAICDSIEWEFDRSIDTLIETISEWKSSSAHLMENVKPLVIKIFESKGADLFYEGYSDITRRIGKLAEFCDDEEFILDQVLNKIATDNVALDGNEWLQLATTLCSVASDNAKCSALELMLSGPATRMADEVGEGALHPEQMIPSVESEFFADIIWHLLGDNDAYVRWNMARGLSTLVDLGLESELNLLLDRFDKMEVPTLASKERMLPYQNSQEWLLIGIARAALKYGPLLASLRPKLLTLASRDDIHVMHKTHIARCLKNIGYNGSIDTELQKLRTEIDNPKHGIIVSDDFVKNTDEKSDFSFDYEFGKTEIDKIARMFGVSHNYVGGALAAEITKRWPDAKDLNYFGGHDRYRRDRHDRYEDAREHVQKHALFSVATNLAATKPVVIRSYDADDVSPWREWRDRYDITFDDGSWLSDRKDAVPKAARDDLLGQRDGQQQILQDQNVLLTKIGLIGADESAETPIYGQWYSPDDVSVSIVTALTEPKGAIGRCASFAKLPSPDLWLPELWDEGRYDRRYRQKTIFEPLIWAPENHNLGIDQGDEIAAHNAASRPRLGLDVTLKLGITPRSVIGDWSAPDESLALKSKVWGSWQPDHDQPYNNHRRHKDGAMLLASKVWLDTALKQLNRKLVYTITFQKYRSSRDYDRSSGVKLVLVGLRTDNGQLRIWPAKKASVQD